MFGSRSIMAVVIAVICTVGTAPAQEAEVVTTSGDRTSLSLTLYNTNLALVRDSRAINLARGEQTLAFKEISSQIQPETAVIKAKGVGVLEQNYEFDLLSPESLLRKYVGKEITLVRPRHRDGSYQRVSAKVLSVEGGVVLQVGDQIETGVHGRIVFDDVPANLRERPTLTMVIATEEKGRRQLELSYLSEGLSWKADYVAKLNQNEDRVDLQGWVTLNNTSGARYDEAKLQLVAGDVNRVRPDAGQMRMALAEAYDAQASRTPANMKRESLFEYHLYSVERPTTLLDNQSKQIALLQEQNGRCRKELVLASNRPQYYWSKVGQIEKGSAVDVFLKMKNDKASNLGSPKPAGIVRVYKEDNSGFLQFIGEDRIDHTPENEMISIRLGKAFDVTADRVQTDFSILRGVNAGEKVYESSYRLTLRNAKEAEAEVLVEETIPGDWQIVDESQPHEKKDAATAVWPVRVDAKGESVLEYRVRQVMR